MMPPAAASAAAGQRTFDGRSVHAGVDRCIAPPLAQASACGQAGEKRQYTVKGSSM